MSQLCATPLVFKSVPSTQIQITNVHINELSKRSIRDLLETSTDGALGLAPQYTADCTLSSLAISSATRVLHLRFSAKKTPTSKQRDLLQPVFLSSCKKFTLQMDVLSTSLYTDLCSTISQGVDMLSAVKGQRDSREAILNALGGKDTLGVGEVDKLFFGGDDTRASSTKLSLTAWVIFKAVTLNREPQPVWKLIDTNNMSSEHLIVLSKLVRDAQRLHNLKPTIVKNTVSPSFQMAKSGEVLLQSTRYQVRLRNSSNITRIVTEHNGKQVTSIGQVKKVNGREARLTVKSPLKGKKILSVTTVGREPPTLAEQAREKIIISVLQGASTILTSPFVQRLWLPLTPAPTINVDAASTSLPLFSPTRPLNPSQCRAASAILSSGGRNDSITVIHGPPGTGKTTVIAASVISIDLAAPERSVWLIAQSNVAVKNIAEKLASVEFLKFHLLISKEFHFDWHEHLYEKLERRVIRSDSFAKTRLEAERQLAGCKVILCTLSMLANDSATPYTRVVPIETVIFDEASQIEVGCYLPMLSLFRKSIKKLIFIGDDKQLPPHGEGDVKGLQSIFEMEHIRTNSIFLDTQYRMPTHIGNFISKRVYGGQLKTVHDNNSKRSCLFVDVAAGEEKRQGTSWMNLHEVRAVIDIARRWHKHGKTFRIITPYDAQRSKIESTLKAEKLPWEDKCFNVDAFQGNEEDHILISLVRSEKIGFLREARRVNVMLSRCKQSMIICTSRGFVQSIASKTLVGKLAAELGAKNWVTVGQVP